MAPILRKAISAFSLREAPRSPLLALFFAAQLLLGCINLQPTHLKSKSTSADPSDTSGDSVVATTTDDPSSSPEPDASPTPASSPTPTPVPNIAPTVTAGANFANASRVAGMPITVAFTLADADGDPSTLSVSASSSNTSVVPNTGFAFAGSGASRTLTVTPSASQTGAATITVTASDGIGSGSAAFTLTFATPVVSALFPTNGANWMDWVKIGTGFAAGATDVACDPTTPGSGCIHAGEYRKVPLTGVSDCSGVTATDALGAFDWTCEVVSGTATVYSNALKAGKGLSDLINASGTAFLTDSVTLKYNGSTISSTSAATWWTNTVSAVTDNSAGSVASLSSSGTIYTLAQNRATRGYNLGADKVGLVVLSGYTLTFSDAGTNFSTTTGKTASPTNRAIVAAGSVNHVWIEGQLDGSGGFIDYGVYLKTVKFSRLHRVTVTHLRAPDGASGTAGSDGSDGAATAPSWSFSCVDTDADGTPEPTGESSNSGSLTNGGNGSDGGSGSAGSNAYGVMLSAATYNEINYLTVSAVTGGNGGNGGAGGRGGNGATLNCLSQQSTNCGQNDHTLSALPGLDGSNGGNGGNGGTGGNAGAATGLYLASASNNNTVKSLQVSTITAGTPGTSGTPGIPGTGGSAGDHSCDGSFALTVSGTTGNSGFNTSDGSVTQSYGARLLTSSNNAFKTLLSIFGTYDFKCSSAGGTNTGLVTNTCTSTGVDGSSTYPAGSLSDAVLKLTP